MEGRDAGNNCHVFGITSLPPYQTVYLEIFVKLCIKHSQNGDGTLPFTCVGKSFSSRDFLTSQICLFKAI